MSPQPLAATATLNAAPAHIAKNLPMTPLPATPNLKFTHHLNRRHTAFRAATGPAPVSDADALDRGRIVRRGELAKQLPPKFGQVAAKECQRQRAGDHRPARGVPVA